MGIFDKKTDWSHISDEVMNKNIENARHGNRFRLELHENNFQNIRDFMSLPAFRDCEILDSTGPSQSGDLTIPSIYIVDNKFVECARDMAIHGLMLTVLSFDTKLAFCLETYSNAYIDNYDATKNSFYPFIVIDRKSLFTALSRTPFVAKAFELAKKFD